MYKSQQIIYAPPASKETEQTLKTYQSLGKYLLDACSQHEDAVFMIDADAESDTHITFRDVLERSGKIAKLLKSKGVLPGSVIAIVHENSLDYPILFLAILRLGATCTCVNPLYSKDELVHAFTISKASMVITSNRLLEKVKNASEKCEDVKDVIDSDHIEYLLQVFDPPPDGDLQCEEVTSDSTAFILYSSGTTSMSKGVKQSQKSWIYLMEIFRNENIIPFPEEKPIASGFLPMSHTYGMFAVLGSLVLGHTYVLIKKYYEETFLEYIEAYEMSILYVVPSVAIFLATDERVGGYDMSSVRLVACGGGVLPADTQARIQERFNCEFLSHCGMTETIGMTLYSVSASKPGVTGHLVPGMMAKIIYPETGEALGPLEKGEYVVQGPLLFSGYLGAAAKEDLCDEDGWFHTGDIAYYDKDEDFFIVDRLKELIKYKGYQVPPAELEVLILQHPGVAAVGVVGVPDKMAGELPRAYIVKAEGSDVHEEDILKYVAENISPMKKLRGGVRFVEDLPRTSTGKVNRKELKRLVTTEL